MKAKSLSPAGAAKRNSLSNNIIKEYNYLGKDEKPYIARPKIFTDGNFDEPSLPVFSQTRNDFSNRFGENPGSGNAAGELISSGGSSKLSAHRKLHGDPKPSIIPDLNPIEKLKNEYEHRLKRENQESYLRGLNEGRNQGRAEWAPQSQRISQAMEKAMTALSSRFETHLQTIELSVADLAVFLAEKIVGEAISRIPDVVKENVDKCLKLLAGSGNVIIKISPADYDVIKAQLPSLMQRYEGKFTFCLEPAQNISPGGCFLELDGSLVDGRIETQLNNIKQHIQILG
jgi:flagellar biosynthesis/type III secretory pathway protein FliH